MRARRIQHCHNLRKEAHGRREKDWFREIWQSWRRERSLKLRKRETLIRNSLSFGGDTSASGGGGDAVRSFRDCLPCQPEYKSGLTRRFPFRMVRQMWLLRAPVRKRTFLIHSAFFHLLVLSRFLSQSRCLNSAESKPTFFILLFELFASLCFIFVLLFDFYFFYKLNFFRIFFIFLALYLKLGIPFHLWIPFNFYILKLRNSIFLLIQKITSLYLYYHLLKLNLLSFIL